MIDIHCHILPQLDDGPKSLEQSLEMCQQAVENGYTDIIATPHHLKKSYDNPGSLVKEQVNQLNVELNKRAIPLIIHAGQELRIHEELLTKLQQGEAITLADSNYVLIELPTSAIPLYSLTLVSQLIQSGYKPIIAHPERNSIIKQQPDKLTAFIDLGVYTQLTWKSLSFNSNFKKISKTLIRKELIHFIATDAHDTTHRPINSLQIKKWFFTKQMKDQINYFEKNAIQLLKNEMIETNNSR